MKHFSKWGIAPLAFAGALLLAACPTAPTATSGTGGPGGPAAVVDNCETTTNAAATNILVLFGDGTWEGYEGTDCSEVTYSDSRMQAAQNGAEHITVTDETDSCYAATPNCIQSVRASASGDWGGFFYNLAPVADIRSYTRLCVAYKLEANSDAAGFTFVLEDPARVVGDITTQSRIEISAGDLTDDDTWQVHAIPLGSLSLPSVHDDVNNFGVWNQTVRRALVIDEVYFTSGSSCLPTS